MPSSVTTTYDGYHRIQEIPLLGRIVLQPHTWYTCPAGKRAIVNGVAACTSFGEQASKARLRAGGEIIRSCTATGVTGTVDVPVNEVFPFSVGLNSGQSIQTTQSVGTNAEWEINAFIMETDI